MSDRSRRQFLADAGKSAVALLVVNVIPGCEETVSEAKGEALSTPFLTDRDNWFYYSAMGDEVSDIPRIKPGDWKMSLSSGGTPVGEVTFDDLKSMEGEGKAISLVKTMRCVDGRTVDSVAQTLTATGIFRGVPLRDVLDDQPISGDTTKLRFTATDGFKTSISWDRLQKEDALPVIMATELNGAPLTQERGGPVRVIIPEMWAFKSIKWPSALDATSDFSTFGTYETGRFAGQSKVDNPALMALSAIETDPGKPRIEVSGDSVRIEGVALSGGGSITAVEFSVDGGGWVAAELPNEERVLKSLGHEALLLRETEQFGEPFPYASVWVPWAAEISGLSPGNHRLAIRALDSEGQRTMEDAIDPLIVARQLSIDLNVS